MTSSTSTDKRVRRVGVVGGRGYVGGELLPMLFGREAIEVAWMTSQSAAGKPVREAIPSAPPELLFRAAEPALLAREPVDAVVLALPNGESAPWVEAAGDAVVVDVSSDHRFDSAWTYGQPERFRAALRVARRIASPGCYATAAQLAIAPLLDVLSGPVHVFGVSGYSGAGTARSERNDPAVLRDNVVAYALVDHAHERELRRHLGCRVHFVPHVAPFFRGLVVTASMELARPLDQAQLQARFAEAYGAEPLVTLTREPPHPRDLVGTHGVTLGGFGLGDEGRHVVIVAALDNLLGGAASHVVRALNLALGLDERQGLERRRETP